MKFNKVQFLTSVGLMNRTFNYQTFQFERSAKLRLRSYLITLLQVTFLLKISYSSTLYPREDLIQLWIGNPYNYLPDAPRTRVGLACLFVALWAIGLHIVFNHLNARKDYRLYKSWMRLTFEIPAKSRRDYKVAGLSARENFSFWLADDRLNRRFTLVMNCGILVYCFTVHVQLSVLRFQVEPGVYLLMQTVNVIHSLLFIFSFLHSLCTTSLFYISIIRFLARKLRRLSNQMIRLNFSLNQPQKKKNHNRTTTRLICEHIVVRRELIEMNCLFKNFVGCNVAYFFVYGVLTIFAIILAEYLAIKIVAAGCVLFMYTFSLLLPFVFGNSILVETNKAKRLLENLAFKSASLANRQKIEMIVGSSETACFTCSDWLQMGSHQALTITLEFGVYLLLLIQAFYFYQALN